MQNNTFNFDKCPSSLAALRINCVPYDCKKLEKEGGKKKIINKLCMFFLQASQFADKTLHNHPKASHNNLTPCQSITQYKTWHFRRYHFKSYFRAQMLC